jgi:hypothetical protein
MGMPTVRVTLPLRDKDHAARKYLRTYAIPHAVAGIRELGVQPGNVDVVMCGSEEEENETGPVIIVEVHDLIRRPERTDAVRQELAQALRDAVTVFIQATMRDARRVTVILGGVVEGSGYLVWSNPARVAA